MTADFEQVNYSKANLSSKDFSMLSDNQEIVENYQKTSSIRLGGELRFDIFRVRAGGGIQGDPFMNSPVKSPLIKTISAGVGIRKANLFADFALVHSSTNSEYYPYLIGGAGEAAFSNIKTTQGLFTMGFNF